MKKIGTLNQPLSEVIAGMGHGDMLVIADSGLPIPQNVKKIDLALTKGVPDFITTLRVIMEELKVESIILAKETAEVSPALKENIDNLLKDVPCMQVTHEEFKNITYNAVAIVRTGEFTPYANIILKSGVIF